VSTPPEETPQHQPEQPIEPQQMEDLPPRSAARVLARILQQEAEAAKARAAAAAGEGAPPPAGTQDGHQAPPQGASSGSYPVPPYPAQQQPPQPPLGAGSGSYPQQPPAGRPPRVDQGSGSHPSYPTDATQAVPPSGFVPSGSGSYPAPLPPPPPRQGQGQAPGQPGVNWPAMPPQGPPQGPMFGPPQGPVFGPPQGPPQGPPPGWAPSQRQGPAPWDTGQQPGPPQGPPQGPPPGAQPIGGPPTPDASVLSPWDDRMAPVPPPVTASRGSGGGRNRNRVLVGGIAGGTLLLAAVAVVLVLLLNKGGGHSPAAKNAGHSVTKGKKAKKIVSINSAATDTAKLEIGRIFPPTLRVGGRPYARAAIDTAAKCDAAVGQPLADEVAREGCLQQLRATYTSNNGVISTVALLVFKDRAHALAVYDFAHPKGYRGGWLIPLATSQDRQFGPTSPSRTQVATWGRYIVIDISALTNNQPIPPNDVPLRQANSDLIVQGGYALWQRMSAADRHEYKREPTPVTLVYHAPPPPKKTTPPPKKTTPPTATTPTQAPNPHPTLTPTPTKKP
jgi:hypothetical protein